MTRPWRIRYAGAKYHLTARGNGREAVFLDEADCERFVEQLKEALEKDEVVLYAYALMPNHYHLLIETPSGNVNKFMQRLNTAYGMYFRYKHNRAGHCFQGRYGAKLVEGDDYILRLTRYIHLNPVKTEEFKGKEVSRKKAYLEGYKWSSYRGYAGIEPESEWVNYRWLKLMGRKTSGGNHKGYRKYIDQMMGADDEMFKEALGESIYAIGEKRFVERAEEELKAARYSKSDTGDIVWPEKQKKMLKDVAGRVLEAMDMTEEDLKRHGLTTGDKKMLAIELLCRLSSATQREISVFCGYKRESPVGRQRQVLRRRMKEDAGLARRLDKLTLKLKRSLYASN